MGPLSLVKAVFAAPACLVCALPPEQQVFGESAGSGRSRDVDKVVKEYVLKLNKIGSRMLMQNHSRLEIAEIIPTGVSCANPSFLSFLLLFF